MSMDYFPIPPLVTSIVLIFLLLLILYKNNRSLLNLSFCLVVFSAALWLYADSQAYQTLEVGNAEFWLRVAYLGIIFISVTYFHFANVLLEIKATQWIVILNYIVGTIFGILVWKSELVMHGVYHYFWGFYPKAGKFHPLFLIFFLGAVSTSSIQIWYTLYKNKNIYTYNRVQQLKYVLLAFIIFTFASLDFLPNYGLEIYPIGYLPTTLFVAIIFYSIFKHQLLDIKLAVTQLGVFVVVYASLLGVPFLLGIKFLGKGVWIIPTGICAVLATFCAFVFVYLQRKTEEKLLAEEKTKLNLLKKASVGIMLFRDVQELITFITSILCESLNTKNVKVYMLDLDKNLYVLWGSQPKLELLSIESTCMLVDELRKNKLIYYDNVLNLLNNNRMSSLKDLVFIMEKLSANIIIPIIAENILFGFIVLGDKKKKVMISLEFLEILTVIGTQTGQAIVNCRLWERQGVEQRRASLDYATSSLAHEINNPMGVIDGQIQVLKMYLGDSQVCMNAELKDKVLKSMEYILEASSRVTGMIRAIQEYSRNSPVQLTPVSLKEVDEGYWKLIGHAFKKKLAGHEGKKAVVYIREIEDNLPVILGDKIQLEEMLINFANNALHAVRDTEKKEIKLKIFRKDEDWIRIEYVDTGYGIDKIVINEIFSAHMTTKSPVDGMGLGLFRVKKIVELHKGKIWAESEGKGKGAKMVVELLVYNESNRLVS